MFVFVLFLNWAEAKRNWEIQLETREGGVILGHVSAVAFTSSCDRQNTSQKQWLSEGTLVSQPAAGV